MNLLNLLVKTILMICVPAYIVPYVIFSLGFGRFDWFIGTNEIYATLFSITTTVIFLIMSCFILPAIIEKSFEDIDNINKDNNTDNEEEDEEY
jgi:hypothetical protein